MRQIPSILPSETRKRLRHVNFGSHLRLTLVQTENVASHHHLIQWERNRRLAVILLRITPDRNHLARTFHLGHFQASQNDADTSTAQPVLPRRLSGDMNQGCGHNYDLKGDAGR